MKVKGSAGLKQVIESKAREEAILMEQQQQEDREATIFDAFMKLYMSMTLKLQFCNTLNYLMQNTIY